MQDVLRSVLFTAICGLGLLTTCGGPDIADGAIACGPAESCPPDFTCGVDGQCYLVSPADAATSRDAAFAVSDAVAETCSPSCDDNDPCTVDTCTNQSCSYSPAITGSQQFEYTGSLESFVVPQCVNELIITAYGAQGGNTVWESSDFDDGLGGKGAQIVGRFPLSEGTSLSIMVGEMGQTVRSNAGGGGGSFVWQRETQQLLVAAGGGGGAGSSPTGGNPLHLNGGEGLDSPNGGNSPGALDGGGIDGGGGGHADGALRWGAGGTGWLSSGGPGDDNEIDTIAQGGTRPLDGGAGGNFGGFATAIGRGGYGGGGGGQGHTGSTGSGGGGGYSGGAGGDNRQGVWASGGGGGSFNVGSNQDNVSGVRAGNGHVEITW